MKFKLLIIFCFFLITPFFVEAKSYDFYVDDSASGEENGSKDDPFKKISDAIDDAIDEGGEKEIFIEKGSYDEDLMLGKSLRLYGKDEGSVKIIGTVTMKDGSRIENLTIDGGNFAVVVKANADVEIKNCTIEDFGKTGIHTEVGGGDLVVTGSKIRDGEGKGFYIQKGKKIRIIGNEVYDNGEEGIDIRSNVDGEIKNNIVRENGESGMEIVVGKTELEITNNNIKYNGSSGIATQFYKELSEKGNIYISGNDLYGNVKYGLDCNTPQGGNPGKTYWSDSIEVFDNNINKNKLGVINGRCNFKINEIEEEAVEKDVSEEIIKDEELTNIEDQQKIEEEKLFQEENNRKIKVVKDRLINQEGILNNLENDFVGLNNKGKIETFLFGIDQDEANNLLQSWGVVEGNLIQIQESLNEVHLEQEKESSIRTNIESILNEIHQEREVVVKKQKVFFLFSIFKIFSFNS